MKGAMLKRSNLLETNPFTSGIATTKIVHSSQHGGTVLVNIIGTTPDTTATKEINMKKTLVTIIAITALTFGIAAPAQADASDRKLVKSLMIAAMYDQSYDEIDTLCWGWDNLPSMTYRELGKAFNGMGISRSDIRSGIRQAFIAVC